MAPESINYTTFVTPDGQYEYVKMLFGLKMLPKSFKDVSISYYGNL